MPVKQLRASVSPQSGPGSMTEHAVRVRNLSSDGISLNLDSEVAQALADVDELMVTLGAPDGDRSYTIACMIRSRTALDDVVVYSCEYDWSATMDPLGVVEDLLEYMLDD